MLEFLWENPIGDLFFDGVNYISDGIHGATGFRCAFTEDAVAARRMSAAQIARGNRAAPRRINVPARGQVIRTTNAVSPNRAITPARAAPQRAAPQNRRAAPPPVRTGIASTMKTRG